MYQIKAGEEVREKRDNPYDAFQSALFTACALREANNRRKQPLAEGSLPRVTIKGPDYGKSYLVR